MKFAANYNGPTSWSSVEDLAETRNALAEAIEQSTRGESVPAKSVFDEFRAKYGVPR